MQTLEMEPVTGERVLRFVGDRLRFQLRATDGAVPDGARAFLRTTLGRSQPLQSEILASRGGERALPGAAWRDVPMVRDDAGWHIDFTLTEAGYFQAKAYAVDTRGFQVWPGGPDVGVTVHPDRLRTANTIYCAFTRLYGATRTAPSTADARLEARLTQLDRKHYTVVPPSGKLRDLIPVLPHIVDTLGCRILHLLPVNPTPTLYARFGRYGSPYAGLDLTGIDPALVEFDRRTTAEDQFRELSWAVHERGAGLFLDLVINHTGWGSWLQERHPEWFRRQPDGTFRSPGAWGVTWEDLVELEDSHRDLWEHLADAFVTWCRRGVDGFRCDAGYKIPMPVWRYIIARVRLEFPETVFLLEGLGGGWHDTETLLTEGGMQWAYSELFQELNGAQVAGYLDHAHKQSRRVGVLVHYSETHDNERLAGQGPAWSLLRNRLCALTSVSGGFGFTGGVEWLATEKIRVHGCSGLAWGATANLVAELGQLNRLLAGHPCFFDHARLTRLSPDDSPVLALQRESADRQHRVLVLANTDVEKPHTLSLPTPALGGGLADPPPGPALVDLLDQPLPRMEPTPGGRISVSLAPGACHCLSDSEVPALETGAVYRRQRAQAAWLLRALSRRFEPEQIGPFEFPVLAGFVERDPRACLGAMNTLHPARLAQDPAAALAAALRQPHYPAVVEWSPPDARRVLPVPPRHWVLLRDTAPFRATLRHAGVALPLQELSLPAGGGHVAWFVAPDAPGDATLSVERYAPTECHVTAAIRFLPADPGLEPVPALPPPNARALLTNGRGAMARLGVSLGAITSKYDGLLAANLHPTLPVDRHVFVKRLRAWANAAGFIRPLDRDNLVAFEPGPPAVWRFAAVAGDGRVLGVELRFTFLPERNTVAVRLSRCVPRNALAIPLRPGDDTVPLRVTVRFDLEDRNFHTETRHNADAEHHFQAHVASLPGARGFAFTPAADRQLRVTADRGTFHPQPEWCDQIKHPLEASRGQTSSGDAFSPGWFDLPLDPGQAVTLLVDAEPNEPRPDVVVDAFGPLPAAPPPPRRFDERLVSAARAFVVRRDDARTVIAGYPWFLDWGRDTLICARGLLAAGLTDDVRQLLVAFGRFEEQGTLPNTIHGDNASNRDTSDAALWYGVVAEDLNALAPDTVRRLTVDPAGRTVADVLHSIATHHLRGTPNGIRVDRDSGLVWSPSHFTWMDTNHPAGTPREGYPIEIQALWIRLLRHLDRLGLPSPDESWATLDRRATASLESLFWLDDRDWFADCLLSSPGTPARAARPDTALRSNALLPISLGLIHGPPACHTVEAARRYLVVPGALRSLAPLPVSPPHPIRGADGRLLNDPEHPYWSRYEGDEDTRRKPAYHNGTAWGWMLPVFCEALVRAWNISPPAVAAARAYLLGCERLLDEECLGHLPEILDGDAPHTPRGCDAQAWSATEALRVWRWLETLDPRSATHREGDPE